MKSETINAVAGAASKTTLAGALGGFRGWITDNATLGLLGVLVNWYYRRKADRHERQAARMAQAEHQLRQQERQLRIDLLRSGAWPAASTLPDCAPDTRQERP